MPDEMQYQYKPNYIVRPGEVLDETLKARNINHADLALRCGVSTEAINHIIDGTASVSPEMALRFQRVLGVMVK